ncbi:nitrate- and nitrite sensing domain-containing protein [Sphaerisporangium sp. NPDC051017]|uniref:sensor histidine kinase n=1 Tax=Sphaerisporangium sp. NPDC051017 TaxID=3154636 RepID=UPI00343DF932
MASSRSVRFKITASLVIPLLSLAALWIFGASVTTRESDNLLSVAALYEHIGGPGDELTTALQREHVISAEYLGARSQRNRDALIAQRQRTDEYRERMRRLSLNQEAQADLTTPAMRTGFADAIAALDHVDTTRSSVDIGSIDQVTLTREFARFPDAMQKLVNAMSRINDVSLYQHSRGLISIAYSKDFLARERALVAGALIAGRELSPAEQRLFAQLTAHRRFLFDQGLPDLPDDVRAAFDELAASEGYKRFEVMEDTLLAGTGLRFPHSLWRGVADELEGSYQNTITWASGTLVSAARPMALGTLVQAGLAGVLGLIAVVASLVVAIRVGRGLTRELAELRASATDLASVRLPRLLERLRRGETVDVDEEAPPFTVRSTTTEVRDVGAAFGTLQRTAVVSAAEQARIRDASGRTLRNLARRNQSLLQAQLKLLDGLQRDVEDPDTLRDLFRVDHLTTRMRRHAEGLVILSGGTPGRIYREDVPAVDAVRAAVSEVEDYTRVRVHPVPDVTIARDAAADVIHLCAEIIENAAVFSPPTTEVSVRGELVARGLAIEIEDRGLGMSEEDQEALNRRLSSPPEFDPAETERLGLHVVGRLAARHDIHVELRGSPYGGTTAIVLLPESLITQHGDGEAASSEGPPESSKRPTGTSPTGGLPRRVRNASLAPQLAQEQPGSGRADVPDQARPNDAMPGQTEKRSPEETRALLNSLQPGWRRGRADGERGGEKG